MFKKLEQNFINQEFEDWSIFNSSDMTLDFKGEKGNTHLKYFYLNNVEKFLQVHTRKFCKITPTIVRYAEISGPGFLGAHIDHGPKAALNFYISAGTDETIFYKKKTQNIPSIQYPGQLDNNVFRTDDLIEESKFVSNSNEAYLLDVSKIHSVNKITDCTRIFIAYLWYSNSYEEILENLC